MLESLDSSVARVVVVDFSISRRMVMLAVQRGSRIVVVVCCSRCRMVVMAEREGRCVKSGGCLEVSCEAAWSDALLFMSMAQ